MGIKSKNIKILISSIAFFIGVSLLIGNIFNSVSRFSEYNGFGKGLKDSFQTDYQNTRDFRIALSNYLEEFLAMATGGPVYSNYDYSFQDTYGYSNDAVEQTDTEIEATASYRFDVEANEEAESESISDNYEEDAKSTHEYLKNDKNILYKISYDNKVLYTNAEGESLDGPSQTLPKGYNFLLYFDGNSVKITKDGKNIDVYKDGYYREDNDWYVPGYKNFTVDDKTKNAVVCIAATKNPMIYVKGNYASSSSEYQNNRLYWIEKNMYDTKEAFMNWMISCIFAVLCLIIYVILRKEKSKGDRFAAMLTQKLWMECKVGILIFTLICALYQGQYMIDNLLSGVFNVYSSFDYYGYHGYEHIDTLPIGNVVGALVVFWICYFFVNDLRYNRKNKKRSFIGLLLKTFQIKNLNLPFQKKMISRYLFIFLGEIILSIVISFIYLIICLNGSYYEELVIGFLLFAIVMIPSLLLQFLYMRHNKLLANDIGALIDQIASIRDGNLSKPLDMPEDTDLSKAVENLNDIQKGMDIAVQEQIKSERMKVELVSNVSHDIKTPLTSIISYVDLLNQEEDLPPHIKDYVHILDSKSQRLKAMVQDVFEVSKAASKQLPVNMEPLDLGKLLRQTLADMAERTEKSSIIIKTAIPEESIMIMADGQRLYRVFQNLLLNALQYSMDHSRVFITLKSDGTMAVASVKNISKNEIPDNIDFTERFVRGEASRTEGGNGLGLSIAKSFTEACQGTFHIEANADLFVVSVEFEEIKTTIV